MARFHFDRRRAVVVLAGFAAACRAPAPRSPAPPSEDIVLAEQLLCGDLDDGACLGACPEQLPPRARTECLLAYRFQADPVASALARDLYRERGALVGIGQHHSIDGYPGEEVSLYPALPTGADRRHLLWLRASLSSFDRFVARLAERASRPVVFTARPRAFAFYRTAEPSYPSAYCSEGVISYNLAGPLHAGPRDSLETLFHELFHINDAHREGWTTRELAPVFDAILERCGEDHECLRAFAPHDTLVPDGTFYGFDPRVRDVREYGAELALRFFLEHEAVLAGEPRQPPFKCLTPENALAWEALSGEFFGGVDLTPPCP